MKKIISVILTAVMALSIAAVPVHAAGEMTVSALKYYRVVNDYTLDEVDAPVNGNFTDIQSWNGAGVYGTITGTFKSEVDIKNGSGKDAALISAVYDVDNNLVSVAADKKETAKETDTLSVTTAVGGNQTIKNFVWDSVFGMKPLSVQVKAPKISYFYCDDPQTVKLAWFNEGGSYSLYKNGVAVDISGLSPIVPGSGGNWGKYPIFAYTDNSASSGDKYVVQVNGVSSDELVAHFEDGAYISMGNYVDGRNMIYSRNDDALWYNDTISKHLIIKGVDCDSSVTRYYNKNRTTQYYFKMNPNYLSGSGNTVDVTVNYFDEGTGTIYLQYYADTDTSSLKSVAVVQKSNTNEWKSATCRISGASFLTSTPLNDNAQMRINGGTISRVELAPYVNAEPTTEIYAEVNAAGTAFEGDLVLKRWYNDKPTTSDCYDREIRFSGEDGLSAVGGKHYSYNKKLVNNGGSSWKDWRNAWYFDVPESFLALTNYEGVEIAVEYYAPSGSGEFGLLFNKDAITYKRKVVSGQWTTEVFEIPGDGAKPSFNNTCDSNGDADFRIMFYDCQAYIHKVTVKKVESATENITIHLVGDSICEYYEPNVYPREGWGMEFGKYFLSNVTINNAAKGGCTTKSYLDEGRFDTVMNCAKAGDYLFIQLGHNDYFYRNEAKGTKPGDMNTEGTYNYYLKYFVEQARAKGVIPVFLTSAMIRYFADGVQTAEDGIHTYRAAMKETGAALGVPVIDVGTMHVALNNAWGEEGTKKFYCYFSRSDYPNLPDWVPLPDEIHITYVGADEISKMVIRGIMADDALKDLRPYVDATKDITQGASPVSVQKIYSEVNSAGTALNGTLELYSSFVYNSTNSYDRNILLSGTAGRSAVGGKHYMFNQEYTGYASGKGWQRWKNAFHFKVPDSFLYGTDYDQVVIEVECYIPSGQIEIEFANGSVTKSVTANQWVTTTFEVNPSDNRSFSNGLNGCDFRLFAKECQGYIHKVTVKKIGDGSSNPAYSTKIYLMGDSICAGAGDDSVGWGNIIGSYFKDDVLVTNMAVAGKSTKNYGKYSNVKASVNAGEYVFIQFGQNDSWLEAPDGRGCDVATYKENLTTWINELKAKGAIPVLLNSVAVHRNFASDGTLDTDSVAPYRVGMQEVAIATGVAYIDVYTPNKTYYNQYWAGTNTGYGFYCTDDVHLTRAGAIEITKIILQGIKNNSNLSTLATYIKADKDLTPSRP